MFATFSIRRFVFAVTMTLSLFFGFDSFADCVATSGQDSYGNKTLEYQSDQSLGEAVLILPPLGGENRADRKLAAGLCARGLTTVILDYKQLGAAPADPTRHDFATELTLTAVDKFLSSRQETKWGIVGASLGSLNASIAFGIGQGIRAKKHYANFRKLRAAVLTVCGGSLADILTTSQLSAVVTERSNAMAALNLSSIEDYQQELRSSIHYDTLNFATPLAREKVLMFSSTTDNAVPAATQENLWHAWGEPKRFTFSTSHLETIVRVYYFHIGAISDFLHTQLK